MQYRAFYPYRLVAPSEKTLQIHPINEEIRRWAGDVSAEKRGTRAINWQLASRSRYIPARFQTIANALFKFFPEPVGADSQCTQGNASLFSKFLPMDFLLFLFCAVILENQFPVTSHQFVQAFSQTSEPIFVIKPLHDFSRLVASTRQRILSARQFLNVSFAPHLPMCFQADVASDTKSVMGHVTDIFTLRLRCHPIKDHIGEIFRSRAVIPLEELYQAPPNTLVFFPRAR
jgi:hypothetical protein